MGCSVTAEGNFSIVAGLPVLEPFTGVDVTVLYLAETRRREVCRKVGLAVAERARDEDVEKNLCILAMVGRVKDVLTLACFRHHD